MDKLLAMFPFLVLASFAVIGLVEYIKTLVKAIRTKSVTLAMVLSPIVCVVVAVPSVPIIFGSEIIGTIAFIFYTGALAVILLAFVQLGYDKVVKAATDLIDLLVNLVKSKIPQPAASGGTS